MGCVSRIVVLILAWCTTSYFDKAEKHRTRDISRRAFKGSCSFDGRRSSQAWALRAPGARMRARGDDLLLTSSLPCRPPSPPALPALADRLEPDKQVKKSIAPVRVTCNIGSGLDLNVAAGSCAGSLWGHLNLKVIWHHTSLAMKRVRRAFRELRGRDMLNFTFTSTAKKDCRHN